MSALTTGPNRRDEGSFTRIARDFTATSALFYAHSLIMAWLKSLTGDAAWAAWYGWLPLVIPFMAIYFVGPIYLLVFGVLLKRPGLILPPLLLISVVILLPLASRLQREAVVRSFATVDLKAPRDRYSIIAFDGWFFGCDPDCQKRAVAISRYQIATRLQPTEPWKVIRRGEGEECQSSVNAKSAAEFLRLGYLGTCSVAISAENLENAIIFREFSGPGTMYTLPKPLASIGFIGDVTEVSEEVNGREMVLGRHISGWLASPLPLGLQPYDFFSRRTIEMGPKMDLVALAAEALDVPLAELQTPRTH